MDIYQSCPDVRVRILETAVEHLFDLDLIDDHILACHRRAAEAWNKKNKLLRDRNIRKKEHKDETRKESVLDTPTTGDTKPEGPSEKDPNLTDQENGELYGMFSCIERLFCYFIAYQLYRGWPSRLRMLPE